MPNAGRSMYSMRRALVVRPVVASHRERSGRDGDHLIAGWPGTIPDSAGHTLRSTARRGRHAEYSPLGHRPLVGANPRFVHLSSDESATCSHSHSADLRARCATSGRRGLHVVIRHSPQRVIAAITSGGHTLEQSYEGRAVRPFPREDPLFARRLAGRLARRCILGLVIRELDEKDSLDRNLERVPRPVFRAPGYEMHRRQGRRWRDSLARPLARRRSSRSRLVPTRAPRMRCEYRAGSRASRAARDPSRSSSVSIRGIGRGRRARDQQLPAGWRSISSIDFAMPILYS